MPLELQAGKAVACIELNRLLCGNLENRNVEKNADDGDLAYEVSESLKDYQGHLYGSLN